MREILFRGKRADNGEWIDESETYIKDGDGIWLSDKDLNVVKVISETVGQDTGIKDKNGKKIFEGDIVETQEMYDKPFSQKRKSKRHIGVVEYKIRGCSNFFNPKTGNWERGEEYSAEWIVNVADYGRFSCSAWGDFYDCEVIGNIHDNPELLKGGAGE